jgi:hypothetical protein
VIPLSRWSTQELVQQVQHSGLVASIRGSMLWRWLHEDAIRPWCHRGWIFPRDPDFAAVRNAVWQLDRFSKTSSTLPSSKTFANGLGGAYGKHSLARRCETDLVDSGNLTACAGLPRR